MPRKARENKSRDAAKTDRPRSNQKRVCGFCESKKDPTYTDLVALRRHMSDRARIVPKARSGACSKHQREITRQLKYARHLSLMPFVPAVK